MKNRITFFTIFNIDNYKSIEMDGKQRSLVIVCHDLHIVVTFSTTYSWQSYSSKSNGILHLNSSTNTQE